MPLNLIDGLVLAAAGAGVWRGGRRGVHVELPRLVSILLGLVAGGGFFCWSERLVLEASHWAGQSLGPIGFVVLPLGAWSLVRYFHARIEGWLQGHFPEESVRRRLGLVVGGCRSLALSAWVIVLLSFLPLGPVRAPLTVNSLFGRTMIKLVRPVYATSHGKTAPERR